MENYSPNNFMGKSLSKKGVVILFLLVFVGCFSAFTQTTEPILRLTTTMHGAKISRLDVDRTGSYVVTASNDKTAKLWDAATGELIQTFRPPIDHGDEGMLYAVGMSPDGKNVVVGGWTGRTGQDKYLYVFNTSTGELTQRLPGLDNVINDIEFSPDGEYFAAGLGGDDGVAIYRSQGADTYNFVKLIKDNSAKVQNLAFSGTGVLATVSYDGYIRLYSTSGFSLIGSIAGKGDRPYDVSFSTDGQKFAIGYDDVPDVEVYSTSSQRLLYSPDLGGETKDGTFFCVEFSQDGNYLFAGGYLKEEVEGNWWRTIRKWDNGGKGAYTDFIACDNTLMDIKSINGAEVVYTSTHPDLGRTDENGNRVWYQAGELFTFNSADRTHFRVNRTGTQVEFEPYNGVPYMFDLTEKTLKRTSAATLPTYTVNKGDINVTNWKNYNKPILNGRELDILRRYEINRSCDISPLGDRIVFGADWYIYCTNADGESVWTEPIQGASWAINITGNGKFVTAAQSGGVINWYKMSDGKLLLTLYVHPTTEKWVLYTPGGYFDASPGAEKYIGWHLNKALDKEGYFFPISKFRSKYYRPDVIENILITGDEAEALRIANMSSNRTAVETKVEDMLPPVVQVESPTSGASFSTRIIKVRYKAKSPKGESILSVKAMVDGRPMLTFRGFKPTDDGSVLEVAVPAQDCKVSIIAENQHGWSVPAEINLKWEGAKPEDLLKPSLYVLAIGVSDYANDDYDLRFAAKDADDFAAAVKTQKGGLYKDVVVKVLTDASATKDNILDGLEWIQRQTTARDMAMVFLAGHGMNDNVGSFYYLPHNADLERMRRTCLMFNELKYTASSVPGKLVMFVDACHSGNVMGGRRAAPDVNSMVNELSDVESGAVVFTSSTGKQYSLENPEWGNGAFTKALIEGLEGKADLFGKGSITVKTLDAYIAQRVKDLTDGQQAPTVVIPQSMPDFPIGVNLK